MSQDIPADMTWIFLHIPKTGGVTVHNILVRQFAPSRQYLQEGVVHREHLEHIRTGKPFARVPQNEGNTPFLRQLAQMSEDRLRGLELIQGHFWFGIHEALPQPCSYITLLRNPVDRVLSLYHHRVTQQNLDMAIEEYIDSARDWQINNEQTRRLVGASDDGSYAVREPCTAHMLELAKQHLTEHFPVVGVTERFDESALLIFRKMGLIPRAYLRKNVGSGRIGQRDIPARLSKQIEAYNEYDIELHRFATEIVDREIAALGHSLKRDLRFVRVGNLVSQSIEPLRKTLSPTVKPTWLRFKHSLPDGMRKRISVVRTAVRQWMWGPS